MGHGMAKVFLSVGSNLGDRAALLRQAVARLRTLPEVQFLDASPVYWTEPWERQPWAERPEPGVLVLQLRRLDRDDARAPGAPRAGPGRGARDGPHARRRQAEDQRYEPRTLDIDILLYDDQVISGPDHLHIPHLLMHERAFVLRPLADLAPELEHPVLYQTIRELLEALADEHEVRPSDLPARWFE